MVTKLQIAQMYAEHGWKVFPVVPDGKRPMTSRGFLDATTDVDTVVEWWAKSEDANVGMPVPQGYVVLDVDSEAALDAIRFQDVDLPTTVHAKTPRGHHFWFTAPPDLELKPQVDIFDDGGVDIRAPGSYVIVPPSEIHGKKYRWLTKPQPANFTAAPDWLLDLCRKDREAAPGPDGRKGGLNPEEILSGVPEGRRDWTLFRYACRLRQQHMQRAEAEVLILHAANSATPQFPEKEALKKVEQAWKYREEEQKEAGLLDWQPTHNAVNSPLKEINWICYPLLRPGLALLWAPSFAGKTMLTMQLFDAVARGTGSLGLLQCRKVGVRFVGYELGTKEDQRRLWAYVGVPPGSHDEVDFQVVSDCPRADQGGLAAIDKMLDENPGVKLVGIDTLARFWGMGKKESGANAFYQESEAMAEIENLANSHPGVCILLIHHSTASKAKVSGTEAVRAIPRCLIHLDRADPDMPQATISVAHNGCPGAKFMLEMREGYGWQVTDEPFRTSYNNTVRPPDDHWAAN